MKKIVLVFREQHNKSYVGGVLTIIRAYLRHRSMFEKNGIYLDTFFYEPSDRWDYVNSKLRNVAYIFQQRYALSKLLKTDNNVILNIHTSREFLFLKDVALATFAKKKYGVASVLTIHVGDINTVFNRISFVKRKLIRLLNCYVDKTVFLSNEICNQFIYEGLDSSKCKVLYNFFDMDTVGEKMQKTAKLHLIYVGAIHREKGIIELLTALCKLNDVDFQLDLCGQLTDESIEDELEYLVSKIGDKINFRGYVSGAEKTELYERADVLILPSYHEGMPLVILEGLSQGCALISTKVGTTPEILNNDNVIWVKTKNSEDIEKAIRKLNTDSTLLKKMQKNNKSLSEKYSIEEHIGKLCNIYKEIL